MLANVLFVVAKYLTRVGHGDASQIKSVPASQIAVYRTQPYVQRKMNFKKKVSLGTDDNYYDDSYVDYLLT